MGGRKGPCAYATTRDGRGFPQGLGRSSAFSSLCWRKSRKERKRLRESVRYCLPCAAKMELTSRRATASVETMNQVRAGQATLAWWDSLFFSSAEERERERALLRLLVL